MLCFEGLLLSWNFVLGKWVLPFVGICETYGWSKEWIETVFITFHAELFK